MKILAVGLAMLLAVAALPVTAAHVLAQENCYYESANLTYTLHENRWVDVRLSYTIYNPSWSTWNIELERTIPTVDVENLQIEGIDNEPPENTGENIIIRMNLAMHAHQRRSYSISYSARGVISGSGPAYKGWFGGIAGSNFRYDTYIITVEGPSGTDVFLTDPSAEKTIDDPPTVRYETQLNVGDDFNGLYVAFYVQPVYYRLTLTEHITNPGAKTATDVYLDAILFAQSGSQFAALSSSDFPLKMIYVDDESNWHGVFSIGTLSPEESKTANLEIIYIENIHESGADENNAGSLASLPGGLTAYLENQKYWETNDPSISQRALELMGTDSNAYRLAERIIEFVDNHVDYHEEAERRGALWTYVNQRGDCDCFSDLTIALSRAAGLPARICMGWVYENETLGGHAWVEFYFPDKCWQPADPTWARGTGNYLGKIDSVHLLQSVHGLTSEESPLRITYFPREAQLTISGSENLITLGENQAAAELINAADVTVNLAEQLLAGGAGNLQQELASARSYLDQARAAIDVSQKIALAQQSIQHANVIVEALGEWQTPTQEGWLQLPTTYLLLLIVSILAAVAGGIGWWLHSRSSKTT